MAEAAVAAVVELKVDVVAEVALKEEGEPHVAANNSYEHDPMGGDAQASHRAAAFALGHSTQRVETLCYEVVPLYHGRHPSPLHHRI